MDRSYPLRSFFVSEPHLLNHVYQLETRKMKKINVAVIGASGYSGEELLRLLLRHPMVNVTCITSRQYANQHISAVFPRFAEADVCFSEPNVETITKECDVAFLALPHGLATEFALPLLKGGVKVIDISADFRLKSPEKYKTYYKEDHPAPELLKDVIYGMPERYREHIPGADLIACPGCYPTSIILPVSAMLSADLIETDSICSVSLSGVSGAGRKAAIPFIFAECNESIRPYAMTGHRHIPEIEQELANAAGVDSITISFIPHLMPITRGIHSTITADLKPGVNADDIKKAFDAAYKNERFVRLLPAGTPADTKHVTMTNMCEIGFVIDERTNRLIISSAIDNLTKGASGQAIQNMNLMLGFEETCGLL